MNRLLPTLEVDAWAPIGTSLHPFNGHFEGWGHVISGLSINAGSSDCQGLFGYVAGGSIHEEQFSLATKRETTKCPFFGFDVTDWSDEHGMNYFNKVVGWRVSVPRRCC